MFIMYFWIYILSSEPSCEAKRYVSSRRKAATFMINDAITCAAIMPGQRAKGWRMLAPPRARNDFSLRMHKWRVINDTDKLI